MKFEACLRGSTAISKFDSVSQLPYDVQNRRGCVAWFECGVVGVNFDYRLDSYSQILACDAEALNWIKQTFEVV
jgi:hypothetical protein